MTFDAFGSGSNLPGGSFTFTHICTGNNLILVVGITSNNADVITGVTYNGVAMALAKKSSDTGPTKYLFTLVNPASGSHTVAVTASGSGEFLRAVSGSYSNTRQSGQPDASAEARATNTTIATSLTQIVNNAWQVGIFSNSGSGTGSAGGGVGAVRGNVGNVLYLGDSNANTILGVQSLNWTNSTNTQLDALQISLADIDQTSGGGDTAFFM